MPNEKDEFEKQFKETDEENLIYRYSITSYGADYPVDGLVKRVRDGSIFVPPFQRNYVWPLKKACRFIESLLLGLPVPGIFLSKETETNKLKVIDGQQRLRTLSFFYEGTFDPTGKRFELLDVNKRYEGRTYKSLSEEDKRSLDDAIIHATIVKQDEPSADESSIYQIFERLNTGGVLLSPQEIRSCIYHGDFNDMLQKLNEIDSWRNIFGSVNKRMRDQELLLRFIALFYKHRDYKKPMKEFLNLFMAEYRYGSKKNLDEFYRIFTTTIDYFYKAIGKRAFRPIGTLNAAVFDSAMVGLANRIKDGPINNIEDIATCYTALLSDDEYKRTTETATTDEETVNTRIAKAISVFSKII